MSLTPELPFFPMCAIFRNFDSSLKSQDRSWGVRNLELVLEVAAKEGLELKEKIEMPANNLSLIFQRMSKEGSD
jgi:Protein of unknown function (DUF938)